MQSIVQQCPPEIFPLIFHYLSNKDSYMFAATCKDLHTLFWYQPIYKTVYIKTVAHEGLPLRRRIMQDRKCRIPPFPVRFLPEIIFHDTFQSALDPIKEIFSLPSLRIIRLGYRFNKPLHTLLPWLAANSAVEGIYFGGAFNQSLKGIEQMAHLRHLHFGALYDFDIESWPPHLEYISFRNTYNRPIRNLPHTVKHIRLSECYDQDITEHTFPPTLDTLKISMYRDKRILGLPPGLKVLKIRHSRYSEPLPPLPEGLEVLTLGPFFNHPLGPLPDSLRYLELGCRFTQRLDNIPASLKEICISTLHHERKTYVAAIRKQIKEASLDHVVQIRLN